MRLKKMFQPGMGLLSVLFAGSLGLSLMLTGFADNTMLLRTVPLDVSGYSEAKDLDQNVKTADSTLNLLSTTKPLLVHMEGLRRAYMAFGSSTDETQKLLTALKERYMADPEDANKYFDYGYAQLTMAWDKNGLFFLRKANDKLASPYTSLAYGLAQIDVDLLIEKASPDVLTTRKMDAIYKLKDALTYNKDDMLSGIWNSYIHTLEGVKGYSAFDSLRAEDVSTVYVPYGSDTLGQNLGAQFLAVETPPTPKTASTASAASVSAPDPVEESCSFTTYPVSSTGLAQTKTLDLLHNNQSEALNFYGLAGQNQPYLVQVVSSDNKLIGQFTSYKAPYIAEDLDGDGKYELVVRQYDKDPYHPLSVYRWNGHCFGQDKKVASYFQ
jgi:hypothetical protein